MFSILKHFLTKFFSKLIKRINKYILIPKTQKTLCPFPSQNLTDLGRLGGLDKGFYGI